MNAPPTRHTGHPWIAACGCIVLFIIGIACTFAGTSNTVTQATAPPAYISLTGAGSSDTALVTNSLDISGTVNTIDVALRNTDAHIPAPAQIAVAVDLTNDVSPPAQAAEKGVCYGTTLAATTTAISLNNEANARAPGNAEVGREVALIGVKLAATGTQQTQGTIVALEEATATG